MAATDTVKILYSTSTSDLFFQMPTFVYYCFFFLSAPPARLRKEISRSSFTEPRPYIANLT